MALLPQMFIHPGKRWMGLAGTAGIFLCLLLPLHAQFIQAAAPSALESDPGGWQDIMPSPDLKGWIRVPVPLKEKLSRDQWHVQDGLLISDGDGGHDMLLLDRPLRDCIFHLEFRFVPVEGVQGYNSGAYIRNSKNGDVWHQAQIGNSGGGHLFGSTPFGEGPKNFEAGSKPNQVKPAGEWNVFELTARGKFLGLWVNGFRTAEFQDCGLNEGYIGLESEGYRIEFRNLKLKVLP